MTDQQTSLEQQLAALQKRTMCPLAEGKLFVFVQAMDPHRRRQIVLECHAKRRVEKNPMLWKVNAQDIELVCCNPKYAEVCPWFKAVKIV